MQRQGLTCNGRQAYESNENILKYEKEWSQLMALRNHTDSVWGGIARAAEGEVF